MQPQKIDHILGSIKAPIDHPLFFSRIFAFLAKERQTQQKTPLDPLLWALTEEYEELSRRLERSQIQESCSVRNVLRTRKVAKLLIDDRGEINTHLLPKAISHLQEHLYFLGPERQYDSKRQEHILKVLHLLNKDKKFLQLLKKFTKPFSNKWAEELIRHTLQLSPTTVISDAHTRQAALSAWLCYLRQNVGSCFATAPAIIIHDEQPELFLQDLLDLIATGSLKRTFGGVENSVPLSTSWGNGDLKKHLIIHKSSKGLAPEIWVSPALIAAFETIGFLNPHESLKQKMEQLENWLKPLIQQGIFNIEELIHKILLQLLGLTEKQLKEYESRPLGMMRSPLLLHSFQNAKNSGGIGDRCANFFQLLETAKYVFKSFADNALLKAWEFTLASFSDVKHEFTSWNLYASLGLQPNEPGGIGQCIHNTIQHKLDIANRKTQDIQQEYEMVYTQVKTLESRMRHASSEKEAQWLKVEYQGHTNEFYFLEEQRNRAQNHAASLTHLYEGLYQLYIELFKTYFQEVYDADMQEITTGPFDDSPAGFRLLYKHGRSNTSQWTLIKNQYEFIDSLSSFFVATEPHIAHTLDREKVEKDLSDIVTAIINHIKTKEFLESALHRMAIAHHVRPIKDPLEHLSQIEKKPWGYTSGGTMNTLVSCYYKTEDKPIEIEKWVENEMELLVFFADTLKQIPPNMFDPYLKKQRNSLLMQSPTHAFLLKPMAFPFNKAWASEEFTYTFIRDHFVRPAEIFVEHLLLDDEMIKYLMQQLVEKIPENYQFRFKSLLGQLEGPLNPIFFRNHIIDALEQDKGLRRSGYTVLTPEEIDGLLYSSLPLFPHSELKNRLHKIFTLLPGLTSETIDQLSQLIYQLPFSKGGEIIMGSLQLQNICKALIALVNTNTTTPFDYHLHIRIVMQDLGFALPTPLIFADTNWVKDMFGFVVNPGTGKLELWRLDYTGSQGYPMSSWKQWVDGSRPDRKWSIYVKPHQYGQF